MVLAFCFTACILDPQASRTSQSQPGNPGAARDSSGRIAAGAGDSSGAATAGAGFGDPTATVGGPAPIAFRAALPESAIGRVDSAELRLRRPKGPARSWRLSVRDSILEAELAGLDPGPADFEVLAYADGNLAYYGAVAWDPAQGARAEITVTLGRVGRVRVDADFRGGSID